MVSDTATPLSFRKARNELIDEATARRRLNKHRDDLAVAVKNLSDRTDDLVNKVMSARPSGLLTVNEIAEAIGRPRSYVDTLWSAFGETTKGKQTRVVIDNPDPDKARWMYESLADAAASLKRAAALVAEVRAVRDRTITLSYSSKLLGPSAIAAEVGIDRNHVLRIARRAGVPPVHRVGAKNQYTNS
jgi:hypothetical protein